MDREENGPFVLLGKVPLDVDAQGPTSFGRHDVLLQISMQERWLDVSLMDESIFTQSGGFSFVDNLFLLAKPLYEPEIKAGFPAKLNYYWNCLATE